jgi:CYTH domain-containing protein
MKIEHQRKFLVRDVAEAVQGEGESILQGYLQNDNSLEVKIRVLGDKATITLKGVTEPLGKVRFTYPIPVPDAELLLRNFAGDSVIEKTRYQRDFDGSKWEVDVFGRKNRGLVVAEIDLNLKNEVFSRPPWLGDEVTDDPRYSNSALARNPYSTWKVC